VAKRGDEGSENPSSKAKIAEIVELDRVHGQTPRGR